MADVLSIVALFASSKIIREVFKAVLDSRSMQFKDIMAYLRRAVPDLDGDTPDQRRRQLVEIEQALIKLQEADLIKERRTPIEDFNTYYVTAEGLNAGKQLRRLAIENSE